MSDGVAIGGPTLNPHFCFSIYFTDCVTCEERALLPQSETSWRLAWTVPQESRMDVVVDTSVKAQGGPGHSCSVGIY